MLPLPNPAPADRPRAAHRRWPAGRSRSRSPRPGHPADVPPGAAPDLLRIPDTARRWTAARPGWSPPRATRRGARHGLSS